MTQLSTDEQRIVEWLDGHAKNRDINLRIRNAARWAALHIERGDHRVEGGE